MNKELEDKIRKKWADQGYDYDVARLAFTLEYENQRNKK